MSLEPFTSNVSYRDKIYRIAFSIGSILIECREYDEKSFLSKLCAEIGYFTKEDLWLRTREYIPCSDTNMEMLRELFSELGISNKCRCPSIIKIYSIEEFLKEEDILRSSEYPILAFLRSESSLTIRIVDINFKETIYRTHPVSFLLRGLRTKCVIYEDVIEKIRERSFLYIEPLLRSEDLNVDLVYSMGTETIISLCNPIDIRDILTIMLFLFTLFKKQDIAQMCSNTSDLE
jgi:HEPN domain-containing protein